MALHLVLREAEAAVSDGWNSMTTTFADLPAHTDDFAWPVLSEALSQDYDILHLFEIELDGIEPPDSEDNRTMATLATPSPSTWRNGTRVESPTRTIMGVLLGLIMA